MKDEKTAMLSPAEVSKQEKTSLSGKIVDFFRSKRKKKKSGGEDVSRNI